MAAERINYAHNPFSSYYLMLQSPDSCRRATQVFWDVTCFLSPPCPGSPFISWTTSTNAESSQWVKSLCASSSLCEINCNMYDNSLLLIKATRGRIIESRIPEQEVVRTPAKPITLSPLQQTMLLSLKPASCFRSFGRARDNKQKEERPCAWAQNLVHYPTVFSSIHFPRECILFISRDPRFLSGPLR